MLGHKKKKAALITWTVKNMTAVITFFYYNQTTNHTWRLQTISSSGIWAQQCFELNQSTL